MSLNTVQLIAYADRLAGDLPHQVALMRQEPWASAFGGVHVLPFYTPYDGADAGFDSLDHTAVDLRLGSWADIADLAGTHDLVAHVIVNHVSAHSHEFQDVIAHGEASAHNRMFLTMSSVFPFGATEDDLARIYRPCPGLPFTPVTLGGERRLAWTTFTAEQIDIDVRFDAGRTYLSTVLRAMADAGVSMVRLDAAGYAVKTAGTSCFITPETQAFIEDLTAQARALGIAVLVAVHAHLERQIAIGAAVDRVYDFALPPLILHALYTGDASALARWQQIRPQNAVTVLDTHDGIGIVDVGPDQTASDHPGLLTAGQLDALVEGIHTRTGGTSRQATGAAASNLDIYQVNSTFYDALARDDRQYLLARAVQAVHPRRSAGLLRRSLGRSERSRPAAPHRRRARHQPAPLHRSGDPGAAGPTRGARPVRAVPPQVHPPRIRRALRLRCRSHRSDPQIHLAQRPGHSEPHLRLLLRRRAHPVVTARRFRRHLDGPAHRAPRTPVTGVISPPPRDPRSLPPLSRVRKDLRGARP